MSEHGKTVPPGNLGKFGSGFRNEGSGLLAIARVTEVQLGMLFLYGPALLITRNFSQNPPRIVPHNMDYPATSGRQNTTFGTRILTGAALPRNLAI